MKRLRAYHALLALLALLAFFSGEWGLVHAWIGYGVAAVIALRLMLALTGAPQLGLTRFYPQFQGLKLGTVMTHPAISRALLLGIAVCAIGAVGTGIAMDKGRAVAGLGVAQPAPAGAPPSPTQVRNAEVGEGEREEGGEREESAIGEAHEALANLMIALVIAHVGYLVLFKRPLVRFMLFQPPARPK